MRHTIAVLAMAVVALSAATSANAVKPDREPVTNPDGPPVTGQCAFPVQGHIEGTEFDKTFVDKHGNPVKLLGTFPGNTITLTNVDTGKSITLQANGTFQFRVDPTGSGSVSITGHGVSYPHPITGEPGLWYLSGHLHETFDADQNATSMSSSGSLVNVCAELE